jgi:hypothetical protein
VTLQRFAGAFFPQRPRWHKWSSHSACAERAYRCGLGGWPVSSFRCGSCLHLHFAIPRWRRTIALVHIMPGLPMGAVRGRAVVAPDLVRRLASAPANGTWRRSALMTVAGGFALSHVSGRTKSLAATVTACGRAARERSRTMPRVAASADPAMCRLGPIGAAGGSAGCPSTYRSLPGAKQTLDSNAPPARLKGRNQLLSTPTVQTPPSVTTCAFGSVWP